MAHLRRVSIRGYRSIVRADLRLGEITVIVGPSDSGKSNFCRALRDWAFNAVGSSFTTEGLNVTRVAVAVGHDDKVIWEKECSERSGSSRYYHASAVTGEKRVYEKVGRTVPHEIVALTGVQLLSIDKDLSISVNFAEQSKESWFLLSNPPWTPGAVTKVIGRVSGIDALILANRDLVNARVAHDREAKRAAQAVEAKRAELEAFAGLAPARELLGRAAARLREVEAGRKVLVDASRLLKGVQEDRVRLARSRALSVVAARAVERADELGLVENLARIAEAEALTRAIKDLADRKRAADARAAQARAEVEAGLAELAAMADGALACPLCGGDAHPECRTTLRAQAGVAVPQNRKAKKS